jgi:GTP cyclohydrolase I
VTTILEERGAPSGPKVDYQKVEEATRRLLLAIGEDPYRPGLRDTPARVAKAWREFIEYDPGKTETVFDAPASEGRVNQMVVVRDMRVWSMCEHHLAPFWCDVTAAYIATDKVIGLSKIARIAHKYAHRLQLQEQLVEQIAAEVRRTTGSDSVAVAARGMHLCMVSRGIKTEGEMISSALHGAFLTDPATRAEFMGYVRG